VLSLGTAWGLFRHYWVVLKLGITLFCTVILLIYMGTFRQMAGIAADPVVDLAVVRDASPIVHAILALILLLMATMLGVYKPLGMTPYGRRKQDERGQELGPTTLARSPIGDATVDNSIPGWIYVFGIVLVGLFVLFVILRLAGGMGHH
jgi:hypothetical protein